MYNVGGKYVIWSGAWPGVLKEEHTFGKPKTETSVTECLAANHAYERHIKEKENEGFV